VKDDRLYLEHILEATEKVFAYTAGGRDEFMRNTMIQDAVVRNFEIIGEAAKRLSDDARRERLEIPWSDIARFRDVLIHHYMGVDLKRVWNVVESYLPALRDAVRGLLGE
jgi:uncharacterized protein with HEPN domain